MSTVHGYHATLASLAGRPPNMNMYIQWRAVADSIPWWRRRYMLRKVERILIAEAAVRDGLLCSIIRSGSSLDISAVGTAIELQKWLHRMEGRLA